MVDTVVTTTSMTAVRVSMRSAQSTWSSPTVNQLATGHELRLRGRARRWKKPIQASSAGDAEQRVVTNSELRSPIWRPNRPATRRAEQRQEDDEVVHHGTLSPSSC